MDDKLRCRLNEIFNKITSREFLEGEGLANEIPCWVFDYPPESESEVREFFKRAVVGRLENETDIRFRHVDLLEFLVEYLEEEEVLERSYQIEKEDGLAAIRKALKGMLHETEIASRFVEKVDLHEQDILLITGAGSVFPFIRTHTLLNNLHSLIRKTVVLFFPGKYDQKELRLFDLGGLAEKSGARANYYRAQRLIGEPLIDDQ